MKLSKSEINIIAFIRNIKDVWHKQYGRLLFIGMLVLLLIPIGMWIAYGVQISQLKTSFEIANSDGNKLIVLGDKGNDIFAITDLDGKNIYTQTGHKFIVGEYTYTSVKGSVESNFNEYFFNVYYYNNKIAIGVAIILAILLYVFVYKAFESLRNRMLLINKDDH